MLFKKKFNLIFSLGEACSCTGVLRKSRLQFYSYPFDCILARNMENSKEDLLKGYSLLKERFGDKINLLYLYSNSEYCLENHKEINLNDNIKCISFDYDAYDKTTPYTVNQKTLASLFDKIKITNKFLTNKNKINRFLYILKLLFRGKL